MSVGWADAGCSLAGGRYRLIARAGSGGMSVVWRAMDTVLDREVAIKLLHTEVGVDADLLKAEAQAIARLKHRHVTGVHDFGEDVAADGTVRPFVVMELVTGHTLQDLIADGKAMPWQKATSVAAQVASALAYAHDRGIVHRDISCANIILTDDGVKVFDFGIAALAGQPDPGEQEEVLLGTPAYIAPERLRPRDPQVMPAADVYALGVVWYQMLAGAMPWTARTSTGLIQAHLVYAPAPLPAVDGLPDRLRELCVACLAKNPLDRPTAHELAAELAGYRDEPGLQATQPIARPGPRRQPRRLLAAGAAALALAALAALTAFAVATWPPGRKNEPQVQVPQAIQASATTASPGSPSAAASPTPTAAPRASIRPAAPPANALPAPAPAAGETVRALGGSVVVVCQDRRVQVLNVTIQPGYTIKELKAGPAPEVHIVLRSPGNESDIRVTCQGEVAVPNIKENPK